MPIHSPKLHTASIPIINAKTSSTPADPFIITCNTTGFGILPMNNIVMV